MKIQVDEFDVLGTLLNNGLPAGGGTQYPWRGAWLTATAYVVNDCVEHDGSGYVCVEDHTSGVFATDLAANKWNLLTSKGDTGAQGTQGIQGIQGPQGPAGTNGTNGADGADGLDGTQYPFYGPWVTSNPYLVNDCVEYQGSGYVCMTAHTSGVFATDLAANKWKLLVQGNTDITLTGKALNIGSTTDILEVALPDGESCVLRLLISILQGDGGTNNTATWVAYDVIALSSPSGSMSVQNGSYNDGGVGVDWANLAISADFITDEVNNKVTLQISHTFTGSYTPTTLTMSIWIKNLDGKTITLL